MGINPAEDDEQVTKEEIQMMLMEGNAQGVIDTQENEFIQNILIFMILLRNRSAHTVRM